jgi:hypothetical protein
MSAWLRHPLHPALALFLAGSALVLAGGFCGGTLVHRFAAGVSWQPERNE